MPKKLTRLWVQEKDAKIILAKLKAANIEVYDEDSLRDFISEKLPNVSRRTQTQIIKSLTPPKLFVIKDERINLAVKKFLKKLPSQLAIAQEMNYVGIIPSGINTSGVQSTNISDPTGDEAIKRVTKGEVATRMVQQTFNALSHIPERYRQGIWEHITKKTPYNSIQMCRFAERTWKKYMMQFKYFLAREIGYADELDLIGELI